MTTQPEALALADELEASAAEWRNEIDTRKQAAALLRAQQAEIERKDALLRQALEALEHLGGWSTETHRVFDAIKKELQ